QPPHLYRLTNGMPPQAPAGNDLETRPILVQQDAPVIVIQPLPPETPPASTTTTTTESVTLPPAVFDVTVKLTKLTLVVKFDVRRTVVLGLAAGRNHKQVGRTRLKTFEPSAGSLQLKLDRKRWPKRIAFLTDAPKVRLLDPGFVLGAVVDLQAAASAIKGRKV